MKVMCSWAVPNVINLRIDTLFTVRYSFYGSFISYFQDIQEHSTIL